MSFLTYGTNTVPVADSTIEGNWAAVVGSGPAFDGGADDDYHLLADGVFRIFYCFLKRDGTYALTLDATTQQGIFQEAAAVVLTLAVLDGDSLKIVADRTALANALPNPSEGDLAQGSLPGELWQGAVDQVSQFASSASIPEAAASRVRIYQRTFSLDAR